MNRWRRLAISATVFALAALAYHVTFPSYTIRHRWTYEFEVDGKPRIGSGVMETTLSTGLTCGGINGGHHCHSFRGEAVPIDLGPHGYVFALLPGVELAPEQIALRLGFMKEWSKPDIDPRDTTWEGLARHGLKAELLPEEIPMLVRFRDITDPASIERLNPSQQPFIPGTSTKFVRASIETTTDEVSEGFEKVLPWFGTPVSLRIASIPACLHKACGQHRPTNIDFKQRK